MKGYKYLEGEKQDEQKVNLIGAIHEFLNQSKHRTLLINSGQSSGKSSFLKQFKVDLWQKFDKGETNYIPMVIKLTKDIDLKKAVEK